MEEEKNAPSEDENAEDAKSPKLATVEEEAKTHKVEETTVKSESPAAYDPKNVHYEGELAVYTDPNTGTQYEWFFGDKRVALEGGCLLV
jgi:hypothetical protein